MTTTSVLRTIAAALLLPLLAIARADAPASPGRLPAVSQRMSEFIAASEVAGAVTMVVSADKVLHLDAVGHADIAAAAPMRPDSIFWIASMTKPMTGVAVMMMAEEGKLSLDDPISKHIPELCDLKTSDGKTHPITIRHLLTHTAGMGEASRDESKSATTLAQMIPVYASKPLAFEPGTQWRYCQSSINTAARIVEITSGQTFDQFLEKRLTGPLGMKDTTFYLTDDQLPRLVKTYRKEQNQLKPGENFILYGKPPTSRDRFPAANGGLFSTAPDYARFCQMLLNNGSLDGKQYLKPETVKVLTSLHTADLKTGFTPGNGWAIGFCLIRQPQGVTAALSPNSFGHGGAHGTQAWIDPVKRRAYILMVQRANFPNADASDVRKVFQDTAAAALP
jgi:CubicO group peptidase (beta-lactamase class C family)